MFRKSEQVQEDLFSRLQVMEKKARRLEQLDRDPNQIKTQPAELRELEAVKETLSAVSSELSDKKQTIVTLSMELSDRKMELNTAHTKIDVLGRRIDELIKTEDTLNDQVEQLEREDKSHQRKIYQLEKDLSDAQIFLDEEKLTSQRYRDRLDQQQADYEDKISSYRVKVDELRGLVERIMDEKEMVTRDGKTKLDALQREYGKLNIEKEQVARNYRHLTAALQTISRELQQMSEQMKQRDQVIVKKIDETVRGTDYLKGEVKRLAVTVVDLTTGTEGKLQETKKLMQDQVDALSSQLRISKARLEVSDAELSKLRDESSKAIEDLTREKLSLQQDIDKHQETIHAQLEEIEKMKSGPRGISQEDMDIILEAQKVIWQDKITEMRKHADSLIDELKEARERLREEQQENRTLSSSLSNVTFNIDQLRKQMEQQSVEHDELLGSIRKENEEYVSKIQALVAKIKELEEDIIGLNRSLAEQQQIVIQLSQPTEVTKKAYVAESSGSATVSVINVTSSSAFEIEMADATVQTDPIKDRDRRHEEPQVIPGEEIVYTKIESIVKDALVTSNLYFSKDSESFSNSYPIDEGFLKDLVHSFFGMAQSFRDMAKHLRAKDIEGIVSASAKDLIFKLDKARDESVVRIRTEQADVMAERIDETVQMMRRDKEAAMFEQRESFERELAMAKSRNDKEIKRLEDMLSDQREMHRKEMRKAREQWERETDDNEHDDEGNYDLNYSPNDLKTSEDAIIPKIASEELRSNSEIAILALDSSSISFRAEDSLLNADIDEEKTLKPVKPVSKPSKSKRSGPLRPRDVDIEILKAQWRLELEDQIRQDIRGEIESEMTKREEQHRQIMLKEFGLDSEDVDRQIQELWKELPDQFRDMDMNQMRQELMSGSLSQIGDVRMENFDRLRNRGFGTDDIIQLTIIEHHMRYDNSKTNDNGTPFSEQQTRQFKMQIKSMEIQRNMLLQRVVQQTSILDLYSYLNATEVHLRLLSSLNAWKSLQYYSAGGIFKDVLTAHLAVLEKCIKSCGGLNTAVSNLSVLPPDSSTSQWPQFFRVKALEIFRSQLLLEARDFKRSMGNALKFLQDRNTVSILHNQNSTIAQTVENADSSSKLRRDAHKHVVAQMRKSYHNLHKILPVLDDEDPLDESLPSALVSPAIPITSPSFSALPGSHDGQVNRDDKATIKDVAQKLVEGDQLLPSAPMGRESGVTFMDDSRNLVHAKIPEDARSYKPDPELKARQPEEPKSVVPSRTEIESKGTLKNLIKRNEVEDSRSVMSSPQNKANANRKRDSAGNSHNVDSSVSISGTTSNTSKIKPSTGKPTEGNEILSNVPTPSEVKRLHEPGNVNSNNASRSSNVTQTPLAKAAAKLAVKEKMAVDVQAKRVGLNAELNKLAFDSTFMFDHDDSVASGSTEANCAIRAPPRTAGSLHKSVDQLVFEALRGNQPSRKHLETLKRAFDLWEQHHNTLANKVLQDCLHESALDSIVPSLIKHSLESTIPSHVLEIMDKVRSIIDILNSGVLISAFGGMKKSSKGSADSELPSRQTSGITSHASIKSNVPSDAKRRRSKQGTQEIPLADTVISVAPSFESVETAGRDLSAAIVSFRSLCSVFIKSCLTTIYNSSSGRN